MNFLKHLKLVLALALWGAGIAAAQIGTSTITGRVTDSSGAVVPRVQVTVVQPATNFSYTAQTNEDGYFRVQSLQPGAYRLTFELEGFKKVVRDNIDLRTGDTLPIDAVMQVGSVADSVQVTAEAPLLETETSATGAVLEGETLYRLPLYQR